ncbi:TetR family transcriptional regulator [Streptococcus macacae NCTC 11558]|uniref:Transcriptional regulator, TetR family n=2 Tax=Streptococcus macacae TaxID=1339 RepID=G5JX72_9STRE|nr:transcriptional regulator, TetR family [Streptococcus macacae NCTC 11558]SUN77845.1 TetR family transcriptional regulator [Streptococcus macacae NCTC 11558]
MNVRSHILDSAQELIYQNGFEATSISDITAAAKVGKGQLYHYFSSKKQIGLEVTDQLLADWQKELLENILKDSSQPQRNIGKMLDWICHAHEDQSIYYGCPVGNLIVELSTKDKDFQERLKSFIQDWQMALAANLSQLHPDWTKTKAQTEAKALIAQIQGALVLLKLSQNFNTLTELMDNLRQKCLNS